MTNWNKNQTIELILLYEQSPMLYNTKSPDFLDRIKKNQALSEICEKLKSSRPEVTPEEVKVKIKTLRTQYLKEKNLIAKSKKSGAGREDVYAPKLWCFDELKFLDKHTGSTPSVSNVPEQYFPQNSDSFEKEHNETISTDGSFLDNRPTKKQTGFERQITKSLQVAEELANNIRNQKLAQKRNVKFAKVIEIELEDLPDDLFHEAKWKIMAVIQEVQGKFVLRQREEVLQQSRASQFITPHSSSSSPFPQHSSSSSPFNEVIASKYQHQTSPSPDLQFSQSTPDPSPSPNTQSYTITNKQTKLLSKSPSPYPATHIFHPDRSPSPNTQSYTITNKQTKLLSQSPSPYPVTHIFHPDRSSSPNTQSYTVTNQQTKLLSQSPSPHPATHIFHPTPDRSSSPNTLSYTVTNKQTTHPSASSSYGVNATPRFQFAQSFRPLEASSPLKLEPKCFLIRHPKPQMVKIYKNLEPSTNKEQ